MRVRKTGSTIVEYGFVGVLILVFCVAAIQAIGGGLDKVFKSMHGGMQSSVNHTKSESARIESERKARVEALIASQNPSPGGGGPTSATVAGLANGGQVCSGGICVAVPRVQVSGSSGTGQFTSQAAAAIARIAQMINDDPNADPVLKQKITQLANSGHEMATAESSIAGCVGQRNNCATGGIATLTANRDQFQQLSNEVRQLLGSGAGSLPEEMKNVVNFESENILGVAHGFNISGASSWSFSGNTASVSTHNSSNRICRNGGAPPGCLG